MGFEMIRPDQFGWDRLLAFTPPRAHILGHERRPDVVFHTMFEATPMPENWVDILNQTDHVWTPSQWCAELFREQGVKSNIVVAGYGYDPEKFRPVDRRRRTEPLKVLIWADVMVSRKNLMKSLQVFMKAGLENATLEIKINDPLFHHPAFADEDDKPMENITCITEKMDQKELFEWLGYGDVLIYLSGGEGYGLQPLEAMATALPVIAMPVTGMREYMNESNVLCVEHQGLTPAPSLTAIYRQPTFTYNPDIESAVGWLHWVADNRDTAAEFGQHGYQTIRHLTWECAAHRAADVLRTL